MTTIQTDLGVIVTLYWDHEVVHGP